MIYRGELLEEIRKCQIEPVTYANVSRMADMITVYNYLYPEETADKSHAPNENGAAAAPIETTAASYSGENVSEFLHALEGIPIDNIVNLFDELMETLRVIHPGLYAGVMRKADELR